MNDDNDNRFPQATWFPTPAQVPPPRLRAVDREMRDYSFGLGAILAKLRKEKGWTQEQLAEKSGVNRSSVAGIEKGKQGVSTHSLYAIAEALDCDILIEVRPRKP